VRPGTGREAGLGQARSDHPCRRSASFRDRCASFHSAHPTC